MMSSDKLILSIVVIAIVTFSTRAFPFIVFGNGKKSPPPLVIYLGKYLPPAIICAILVYSFTGVKILEYPFAIKEIIAVTIVVILQLWKNNSMLSIFSGTIVYMFISQNIFK